MPVRLRDIPEGERPRERLLRRGVEALSDRELLAIVLRSGRPGESALDLATALIADYGGLSGLAAARPEELASRPGVGPAKAAALVAAFRLGALAGRTVKPLKLQTGEDVASIAIPQLSGARRERVLVLVCDAGNRLRNIVQVTDGAVDRSMLPVREVLNAVLRHDGRAFALAHNHPSGDAAPSEADRRATEELAAGAKTVGLRFLDHIVVTERGWSSCYRSAEKTRFRTDGRRA
jgi:DNA repair protein RadC